VLGWNEVETERLRSGVGRAEGEGLPPLFFVARTLRPIPGFSSLGLGDVFAYGAGVIGFLRLVGLINAAAWFGGSVFFLLVGAPVLESDSMREMLGAKNFPYFSGATFHLLASRWAMWQAVFGLVALVHLMAEWLYLGRMPGRPWRALLLTLCVGALVAGFGLEPRAREFQRVVYAVNAHPTARQNAASAELTLRKVLTGLDWLITLGVGAWLWRVANPPNPTRFVPTGHFRG
jgi:hypothetical protein